MVVSSRNMSSDAFVLLMACTSTVSWISLRNDLKDNKSISCQLSGVITLIFITIDGIVVSTSKQKSVRFDQDKDKEDLKKSVSMKTNI
ncbi:hypothetical protein AX774_g6737 [Zancudomyces culisetae]|uniref:Uncharacterized protein n=1 Tax=Zancudomyces culisetae TaxID=1213189 RepID=A0A1R1PFW4_ZANCU|nr:hypothetical protein AX774_g6737 [Zancudomyces culisetae]|eukprot:OMH79836.1 hypothetical protein AX774_g6737 [Zancudomyces culisetae]